MSDGDGDRYVGERPPDRDPEGAGDPEVRRALGLDRGGGSIGRGPTIRELSGGSGESGGSGGFGGSGGRGGGLPPRSGFSGSPLLIVLGAVAAVALLIFLFGTERVDAGEACAVTRFRAVDREVGPGLHFKIPGADDFHCYSTRTTFYEVLEDDGGSNSNADFRDTPVDGVTRDGQPLTITFNIRYRIPPENVGEVYSAIGRTMPQVNENVVKFHARTITRQQVQQFTATDLYSGQLETVSERVRELIEPRFAESFVELEYYELKRPRFQEAYEQAIEAQQIAREQIETRENEAVAAEQEARRVANLAQGDAEAEQIRAAGEATAIALRGEAVRNNPEIISLNYIDALKTINWAILDGASVQPFLDIQAPGGGAAPAPAGTTGPTPTAPAATAEAEAEPNPDATDAVAAPTAAPLPEAAPGT